MKIVPPALEELARLASEIAEAGYPVFPCGLNKAPVTEHGHKDAVDNPKLAYELFMAHPEARLIGVPMGVRAMVVAIDIDPGGMGWLQANWGRLGNPRIHRTPRGGCHLFYRMPKPPCPIIGCRQVCDGRRLLSEGVDVKGQDGYVIFAGYNYTVVNDVEPCDMPIWMKNALTRKPKDLSKTVRQVQLHHGAQALEGALAKVEFSKLGERNNLLYWASCRAGELVKEGVLSERQAIDACVASGKRAGLTDLEALRTTKSGLNMGKR